MSLQIENCKIIKFKKFEMINPDYLYWNFASETRDENFNSMHFCWTVSFTKTMNDMVGLDFGLTNSPKSV